MSVCLCVCVFPIEILYEELTKNLMIESYVIFSEEANGAICILIKVHFWGLRAPYLKTP